MPFGLLTLVQLYAAFDTWLGNLTRTLSVEPAAPLLAAIGLLLVLLVGVVVFTTQIIERLPLLHAPPKRDAISAPHPVALCSLSAPDAPGKVQARAPGLALPIT